MAVDCIFCMILSGELESDVLYRDDDCFVIHDIAPKAPVHLLIIPNQHFTYLTGLTPSFFPVLGSMFRVAQEMAGRESVRESGYRLIINQGDDAEQHVPHLHLHLMAGRRLAEMG